MPRGRPVGSKNKPKEFIPEPVELFSTEPAQATQQPVVEASAKEDVVLPKGVERCELCNKVVYCQRTVANLAALSGKATYFRECKQDRFALCLDCAKELSDLIDKWILKRRPDLIKFPPATHKDS